MLFWTALVQGGHGKNCPVKIFEVYVEIHCIGGFVFWLNLPATGGVEELTYASKVTNKR